MPRRLKLALILFALAAAIAATTYTAADRGHLGRFGIKPE